MTVEQQQHLLAYLGYYNIKVDGIAGDGTKNAIKEFQEVAGIDVDGILGPNTEKALKEAIAQDKWGKPEQTNPTPDAPESDNFWDDIKYFSRNEFQCHCGGKYCNGFPYEPSEKLVRLADTIRKELGVPMTVSSGVRCETHNAAVGGVPNSYHRFGRAMDFAAKGKTAAQVLEVVKRHPEVHYTYAINSNYVHMDVV